MVEAVRYFEHPILGYIVLSGDEETGLNALYFQPEMPNFKNSSDRLLIHVENLIQRYLLGEKIDFSHLPVLLNGTAFQKSVWKALWQIPWGETRSYEWLAHQIGCYEGSRAVGQANGKNPLPLVIPCHRVIQKNGALGGYSSGGAHIKNFLLSLEQYSPQMPLSLDFGTVANSPAAKAEALTLL